MQITEKELEVYIFNEFLEPNINKVRQFNLGRYGIPDIVTFEEDVDHIHINIYELKVVPLNLSHFSQICRYKKGFEELYKESGFDLPLYFNLSIICSEVDGQHNDIFFIQDQDVDIWTYELDLKTGIEVELEGLDYHIVGDGFPQQALKETKSLIKKQNELAKSYHKYMQEQEVKNEK